VTGESLHLETERLLLPLGRLTAVIHPDNRPRRALATRLGFRLHRHDTTPGGAHVVVYERLAPTTTDG
jgi:RimJ/RimL family protein N-acetyltransferase